MANCDVAFRCDATMDELIDVLEGNRVYLPCLFVVRTAGQHQRLETLTPAQLNKIDAISIEELDMLYKIPKSVPISAREWMNIDELIEVRRAPSLSQDGRRRRPVNVGSAGSRSSVRARLRSTMGRPC